MQYLVRDPGVPEQVADKTTIVTLIDSAVEDLLDDVIYHIMEEVIVRMLKEEVLCRHCQIDL